ncbi:MAG: hypothetical protein ABWY05_04525 [Noviherbaspirillum sp.]
MRNFLGISLAVAAMAGCAGGPSLPPSSTTQGTTVVRSAVVTELGARSAADAPLRLGLRYDNGATAVVEVATKEVFKVGDKVRVTQGRGTLLVERLDADR